MHFPLTINRSCRKFLENMPFYLHKMPHCMSVSKKPIGYNVQPGDVCVHSKGVISTSLHHKQNPAQHLQHLVQSERNRRHSPCPYTCPTKLHTPLNSRETKTAIHMGGRDASTMQCSYLQNDHTGCRSGHRTVSFYTYARLISYQCCVTSMKRNILGGREGGAITSMKAFPIKTHPADAAGGFTSMKLHHTQNCTQCTLEQPCTAALVMKRVPVLII